MHKNILSFWRAMENLPDGDRDKPSPRICVLLQEMFEKWHSKPPWLDKDQFGHLFDHYKDDDDIRSLSVMERKGLAIQKTLELITRDPFIYKGETMQIHPLELIVGTLPPYSVGQGKELMRYLNDEESLYWETHYLNEWSPFGHTVPNHQIILEKGTSGIIEMCQVYMEKHPEKKAFYTAIISAMKGINHYANSYADRCDAIKLTFEAGSLEYENMSKVSERLRKVPAEPAETFAEALQCIHIMHCALHFTGEIVPLGRLDQLLNPYYEADLDKGAITKEEAQEYIDAFWIKLDEKVILNRRFAEDRFTSSDGALLGSGAASNFDQGALLNQWMQQVTIGGCIANDAEDFEDACNDITKFCLEASRRLPLNSPTLDLRVHSKTPKEIIKLAAETIMSGGAHPVLLNDERIIPSLHTKTGGNVELASARNYACDGCYETLFAGETEFSFGFVPALDALEKALNEGAGIAFAGSTYLRGTKGSYRTASASEIKSFDSFYEILKTHIGIGAHKFFNGILSQYGIKENVSPSPLLSAMISGCMESGRDISGGGAKYKLFSPLMTGISTATDSLRVIKNLVFEKQFMTLEELVSCLRSNWGQNPEIVGLKLTKERIEEIRNACLAEPKFGFGNEEVDELAWKLIEDFYEELDKARTSPMHEEQWETLREKYGSEEFPFEILFAPGVGTFEQYVFSGSFVGATPDGRFGMDPIASDMSPAPRHSDYDPLHPENNAIQVPNTTLDVALNSYKDKRIDLLSDGAPADFNIPEDFPLPKLEEAIQKFANGEGGNIITITVASPETFQAAKENPDDHNLLRVRMGGWTEFFITLFPNHQNQHQRRPQYGH
ncbi:pyruvate formate lyase family protein [Aureisphaera galaxeae]|uniref:pyruvate formate lyase family protein n=1 Tax=Aureisphaera galaxeae TaxID=1538023 RepID=UPI0023506E85|nr:pyruvate formate lyase family protein [Aureisphaera galaxeae]MDC8004302.1 pyruvate formate lyase family protein [Aureisphaera galaxeae]